MPATLSATRATGPGRRFAEHRNGAEVDAGQNTERSEQTEWMLAVRDRRDRTAFARLFAYYAPRVKGVLMRSGMGAAAAEDIVQDVMLSVWHKAAQFDPERAQVSGWIYRIARNRQVDIARKSRRPLPEDIETETPPEADAAHVLAFEQEAEALKQALSRLSPDQRDVIARAYLGDLTHAEVHAQTGLPMGTIKSRIRLGLEKLRHELKDLRN